MPSPHATADRSSASGYTPNRHRNASYRRPAERPFSVDSVLQYGSDIPSQQRRTLPPRRHPNSLERGRQPALKIGAANIPARSTKVSEKLVFIPDPETVSERGLPDNYEDADELSLQDEDERQEVVKAHRRTTAERLPKSRRTEKYSRVTAYCTAQGYKLKPTASFLRTQHAAKAKLYDECLYVVYHLPLLPGSDGYRIRSSPSLKNPGGKNVLDLQIERSEQRDYRGYFEDSQSYEVFGNEDEERGRRLAPLSPNPRRPLSPDAASMLNFGEVFIFSYGVVVFWNFTESQEKNILADITFAESDTSISLVNGALDEADFETEEFHFDYNPEAQRPRVYNDMFTLCTGDHMVKLAMSHAISQSTKLCFFEERMANTMMGAQHIPKRLALTGTLGLKREEVIRILGQLFKSRVDVNLSSNVLDVPSFFWESEPTLHPLYNSLREYLEITSRVKVLNERCRVFLDLAEMLSNSISHKNTTRITWIIIVLIIVSIIVTCFEIVLRFGLVTKEHSGSKASILRSLIFRVKP